MSIKDKVRSFAVLVSIFLLCVTWGHGSFAATVEVENDDDDAAASPTPNPEISKPSEAAKTGKKASNDGLDKLDSKSSVLPKDAKGKKEISTERSLDVQPVSDKKAEVVPAENQVRVRISDRVGFYYFLNSGYVVQDANQVHSIGTVLGDYDGSMNFSTPKKTYIELTSERDVVKPDDLLVVFRTLHTVAEPHLGVLGQQVQNLAIVKVVEVQKKRFLVQVKESFRPFEKGDRVEIYENEIKRWKQAQTKKALPTHAVKCFVAGGEIARDNFSQADFIFLTAGSKKGLVEGQTLQLREVNSTGLEDEALHIPRGLAQVIYAGPTASTAQILKISAPIQKGFEAVYQP